MNWQGKKFKLQHVMCALLLLVIIQILFVSKDVYAVESRIITFTESTERTRSKTITIDYLDEVVGINVDTGSVHYSVNGDNITITVSNGVPTSQYPDIKIVTDYRTSSSDNFPASIQYNSGGYSGTLYSYGSSYVISGSPADSKTVTAKSEINTTYEEGLTNPWEVTYADSVGDNPAPQTYYYSDSDGYSGTLPRTGTEEGCGREDHNVFVYEPSEQEGREKWHVYRYYRAIYSGTVTKPDTRVWQQEYRGTVYGPTISYYSYTVTLVYRTIPYSQRNEQTKKANLGGATSNYNGNS